MKKEEIFKNNRIIKILTQKIKMNKNRIIKFRGWDNRKNSSSFGMTYDIQYNVLWRDFLNYPKYYTLMQFTGLKDKNGREIYEGDITKIPSPNKTSLTFNIHVIKYGIARRDMASGWTVDIPCFYFDLIGGDFKAFPIVKNNDGEHDLKTLEVIGNIFEHPELCKEL